MTVLKPIRLKSPRILKQKQKPSKNDHRIVNREKANEMNLTHEKLFLCVIFFKANINDERFDKEKRNRCVSIE